MSRLKSLPEMSPAEATEAFELEILAPLLSLGFLDDGSSTGWDVLAIMYELYRPDVRTQREAVQVLLRRGVRSKTRRDEILELLVEVLQLRARSSSRGGSAPSVKETSIVHRWCNEGTRGSRSVSSALSNFFSGDRLPHALKALREVVGDLARRGELHADEPPSGVSRDGLPPTAAVDRAEAPSMAPPPSHTETPGRRDAEPARTTGTGEQSSTVAPTRDGAAADRRDADAARRRLESRVEVAPTPAEGTPEIELPEPIVYSVDTKELRSRVERSMAHPPLEAACEELRSMRLAFSEHRVGEGPGVVVVPELRDGHEIWFIGDIHGDLVGFEAATLVIEEHGNRDRTTVFLGDVIDDGFHSYELILRLYSELLRDPDRYAMLAGNHDEALGARGLTPDIQYRSSVDPGDFAVWLNEQSAAAETPAARSELTRVATLFIQLVAASPRALFLPHGLFAAHGGFPHKDLWEQITTPESLASPSCLGDFVWNRWTDYAAKLPNRMSTQSQFGAADFHGFRERAAEVLGREVEAMIRGHDHVAQTPARWERKKDVRRASYQGRILTVNNMSYTMQREVSPFSAKDPRRPTLARWRAGEGHLPTPVEIEISAGLVDWYAPKCRTCGRPNSPQTTHCTAPANTESGLCGAPMPRTPA